MPSDVLMKFRHSWALTAMLALLRALISTIASGLRVLPCYIRLVQMRLKLLVARLRIDLGYTRHIRLFAILLRVHVLECSLVEIERSRSVTLRSGLILHCVRVDLIWETFTALANLLSREQFIDCASIMGRSQM